MPGVGIAAKATENVQSRSGREVNPRPNDGAEAACLIGYNCGLELVVCEYRGDFCGFALFLCALNNFDKSSRGLAVGT